MSTLYGREGGGGHLGEGRDHLAQRICRAARLLHPPLPRARLVQRAPHLPKACPISTG